MKGKNRKRKRMTRGRHLYFLAVLIGRCQNQHRAGQVCSWHRWLLHTQSQPMKLAESYSLSRGGREKRRMRVYSHVAVCGCVCVSVTQPRSHVPHDFKEQHMHIPGCAPVALRICVFASQSAETSGWKSRGNAFQGRKFASFFFLPTFSSDFAPIPAPPDSRRVEGIGRPRRLETDPLFSLSSLPSLCARKGALM